MTGHPEDGLTAWLDGELGVEAHRDVEDHVAGCVACTAKRDDLERVRRMVRDLPAVEAPEGFYESLLRRAARRRRGVPVLAGAVGAVAAVWVAAVGLGVGIDPDPLAPPVEQFVAAHVAARGETPAPMPDLPAPYTAPDALADFALMGGERVDGVVHLTYAAGDRVVSVFQQEGRLDQAGMPAEGDVMEMDGHPMWVGLEAGEHVMVADTGGIVITVVAEMPHDDMMRVAGDLPAGREHSVMENVRRGTRDLLGIFGFD